MNLIDKFKNWYLRQAVVYKWMDAADDLRDHGRSMPANWDCDVRCEILMRGMIKDGLRLGRDFVVVRCRTLKTERNHVFIELFGKNPKIPRSSNVVNGYVIDPTYCTLGGLAGFSKGIYSSEGEDYFG